MVKLDRDTWICVLFTTICVPVMFLWDGFRNLHHYDEFAYLYAAAHYSISALANGQFEPSNVPGFLNVKIGHLMLLKLFVNWFGIGLNLIRSVEAAYTALVVAACGIFWIFAYHISNSEKAFGSPICKSYFLAGISANPFRRRNPSGQAFRWPVTLI
jgi:hypothetical protein